jgi:hypothetical protein
VDCGNLLPPSVRQPAVHGGGLRRVRAATCQCRPARSKAAWPKATAGSSSPRLAPFIQFPASISSIAPAATSPKVAVTWVAVP